MTTLVKTERTNKTQVLDLLDIFSNANKAGHASVHKLMRDLATEVYGSKRHSLLERRCEVVVTHAETTHFDGDNGRIHYCVEAQLSIPSQDDEGGMGTTPYTFNDIFENPTLEAANHMSEIVRLGVSIILNGNLSTVEELARYYQLTQ